LSAERAMCSAWDPSRDRLDRRGLADLPPAATVGAVTNRELGADLGQELGVVEVVAQPGHALVVELEPRRPRGAGSIAQKMLHVTYVGTTFDWLGAFVLPTLRGSRLPWLWGSALFSFVTAYGTNSRYCKLPGVTEFGLQGFSQLVDCYNVNGDRRDSAFVHTLSTSSGRPPC